MTKIKLPLKDLLVNAFDAKTLHIPASIDIEEVIEFTDVPDVELDVHELLASANQMAIVWSAEDVRHVRSDLSIAQANNVLERVRYRHDATLGVTWETLAIAAETLFGPAKQLRIDRCERALAAYDEPELSDLLADALHWCHANGTSFDDALRLARQHFDAETDSE